MKHPKEISLSEKAVDDFRACIQSVDDDSIKTLDAVINSSINLKLSKKVWKQHLNLIKKRTSIENQDLVEHLDKVYNSNFTKLISNCFEIIKTTRSLKKKK